MDTDKGTDLAARVCPRCGEEAGERRFCGGCGLNLSERPEIPTRTEWVAKQPHNVQTATPAQVSNVRNAAADEIASVAGRDATARATAPVEADSAGGRVGSVNASDRTSAVEIGRAH